jgi:uncharacterized protein (DUF952 family)
MELVYRIVSDAEWRAVKESGVFRGSAHDARDGFIHLSAAHQVEGTLSTHYAGRADLVLLSIQVDALAGAGRLEWEASRGGDRFPHFYGEIPIAAVVAATPLPLGPDGKHVLP